MSETNPEASYYIVIPGSVRADKRLSSDAKLMFGEIASKSNLKGFCWATNTFFSELLSCNIRSIQRYIKELEDCGHISIELVQNSEGTIRKIFIKAICNTATYLSPGDMTPKSPPHAKRVQRGGDKEVIQNTLTNTVLLKENNIIPFSTEKEIEQKNLSSPLPLKTKDQKKKSPGAGKKPKPVKVLFRDSQVFEISAFEMAFMGTKYDVADLKHYHEAAQNWSDSKGEKMVDWIAAVRSWMSRDIAAGKLIIKNSQNGKSGASGIGKTIHFDKA